MRPQHFISFVLVANTLLAAAVAAAGTMVVARPASGMLVVVGALAAGAVTALVTGVTEMAVIGGVVRSRNAAGGGRTWTGFDPILLGLLYTMLLLAGLLLAIVTANVLAGIGAVVSLAAVLQLASRSHSAHRPAQTGTRNEMELSS